MRVSYIRRIKDQIPLTLEEVEVLKFTYWKAIVHGNADVIEPLLTRGVPLTACLDGKKTGLKIACEHNNPKIAEMLLVESMRTFQLFPYQEVIDLLAWTIQNKHYQLIDLTIFAVQQHPTSQKRYQHLIQLVNYMEKLVKVCEQNECQPFHFKEFEALLQHPKISKHELYYLYYLWEKNLSVRYNHSIKFYEILADCYQQRDERAQLKTASADMVTTLTLTTLLTFLTLLIDISLIKKPLFNLFPLSVILGLLITGLMIFSCYELLKSFRDRSKARKEHKRDRLLLQACRVGDYSLVNQLIIAGAHVNALMGIAESTPLYEATRFGHKTIVNLLGQFNAYSGKGKETLSFP
jgi:hypothetical protein